MRIRILVLEGAPASVVMGIYENLKLACLQSRTQGDIQLISANDNLVCKGDVFDIRAQSSIHEECRKAHNLDAFIIAPLGAPPKGGFVFDSRLLSDISELSEYSKIVSSVCTGAFLLAASGALEGKQASTHWLFEEQFSSIFPGVILRSDQLVVEDDKFLTSGGANAYQDMTLRLIEKLWGRKVALRCAKLLMLTPDRNSQSEFADYQRFKRHGDKKITEIQAWIEDNYSRSIDVVALAERACLSERHFKRRFKAATADSPSQYWQRVRIDKAKRSLESPSKSIEKISLESGYEDVRFFRTLFKRHTGLTPNEYRKRYLVS